jgi:SAM-dependent methyltransferase
LFTCLFFVPGETSVIGEPYWQALTGRALAQLSAPAQDQLSAPAAQEQLSAPAQEQPSAPAQEQPSAPAQDQLGGRSQTEIEHADGSMTPLWAGDWRQLRPGDASLIDRCGGPTLDVGSGPGRLTMALAERGVPALGIDVTPQAVRLAQSAGALALQRDVFSRVPGTGRWMIVLLADGSIGIGGDPVALLSRVAELLAPRGQALVEVQPPGQELRRERVRFRHGKQASDWFPWAYVGVDQLAGMAGQAGLSRGETWSSDGRWFVTLRKGRGCCDADRPG